MSYPLRPGNITSSKIKLGRCLLKASMAWSPRLQTATSNPSLFSTSSRPRRICGSSSTIKIFAFMSGRFERQAKREATDSARQPFISNISAVRLRDLAGQREAQPRALDAAAKRVVRAIKLLKNLLTATVRKPQTSIQDFHLYIGQRTALRPNAHANLLV